MKEVKQSISHFVQLGVILVLSSATDVMAAGCKNMIWLPMKSGSYLRNHGIQNITVSSQSMCRIKCYLSEKTCLSYNFHHSTSTCEINDSDEFQHPDDLIPMHGYSYTGAENGCQSNHCPSNSTGCQADFTTQGGYKCLCQSGFTGSTCSTDVDECTTEQHNCSANATCTNIVGSFNCKCKDGFLGNGRNCNDVDECTTGQHNCSVNATCINMAGSFICTCKSGYSGDGSNCTKLPPRPVTGTRDNPAKSCLEILNSGDSNGTGAYWIDPASTGNPISAFCDMTTDGGGWTVVRRLVQPNSATPATLWVETYDVIKHYNRTDVNVIPMGAAMLDIKNKMGFHQIHFYCRKVNVGRVVSIMTKNNNAGQAVVSYFTSPGAASRPTACGSFDILPDDTSVLGRNCNQWGDSSENKWGASCCVGGMRIVAMVAHIGSTNGFEFGMYFSCDNTVPSDASNAVPPDAGDTWQISVR